MIVTFCAMLAMQQDGQAAAPATAVRPDTAGKLMSLVFDHYARATSLSGHIHLTQAAKGVTLPIDTDIAFDMPSMLLVRQSKGGQNPRRTTILSDGKKFYYDRPEGIYGRDRFEENVLQRAGQQDVRSMYGTAAQTLVDRSEVIDIAFGRNVDLNEVRAHWLTVKFGAKATVRGIEGNTIEGDYTDEPGQSATGTYSMVVTDAGDILRYTTKCRYSLPTTPPESVEVTSVWDVDLKVNAKNDPKIYRG